MHTTRSSGVCRSVGLLRGRAVVGAWDCGRRGCLHGGRRTIPPPLLPRAVQGSWGRPGGEWGSFADYPSVADAAPRCAGSPCWAPVSPLAARLKEDGARVPAAVSSTSLHLPGRGTPCAERPCAGAVCTGWPISSRRFQLWPWWPQRTLQWQPSASPGNLPMHIPRPHPDPENRRTCRPGF